jgi:branched-chain amino acid aminotransferase
MHVFLQSRLVHADQARVSAFDHGFLYGDGIYETVRVYAETPFEWPAHDHRLRQSARHLSLACPWSSRYLLTAIERLLRADGRSEATVRLSVTRGPGPLGLDPALCRPSTLVIQSHPDRSLEALREKGVSMAIAECVRHPSPGSLDCRIKSTNSLSFVLAKMEARRRGVFETVLLNEAGRLTEGASSNLFFIRARTLHTPDVSCGLLPGITRRLVLGLAAAAGLRTLEGAYRPQDLLSADEIFLTNTTFEVLPVTELAWPGPRTGRRRRAVGRGRPGPYTQTLQALYRRRVLRRLARAGV